MYTEIVDPNFELRRWRRYVKERGYVAVSKYEDLEKLQDALALVDAKSLYDLLIHETGGGSDRRTALDVQVLREELQELAGKIRWIEHVKMPADALTKRHGKMDALRALLRDGVFAITEEAIALSDRKCTRNELGYNHR